MTVGNDAIEGTLKFVTGYTGFSDDTDEQEGNYLALMATSDEGATITAELVGSEKPAISLDDDGVIVLRITDTSNDLKFTATSGGKSTV